MGVNMDGRERNDRNSVATGTSNSALPRIAGLLGSSRPTTAPDAAFRIFTTASQAKRAFGGAPEEHPSGSKTAREAPTHAGTLYGIPQSYPAPPSNSRGSATPRHRKSSFVPDSAVVSEIRTDKSDIPVVYKMKPLLMHDVSYLDDRVGHNRHTRKTKGEESKEGHPILRLLPDALPADPDLLGLWPTLKSPVDPSSSTAEASPLFGHRADMTMDEAMVELGAAPYSSKFPASVANELLMNHMSRGSKGAVPSRRDVFMLRDWLHTHLTDFNLCHRHMKSDDEHLVETVKDALKLFRDGMQEVCRQVAVHCSERGALLADIWNGHLILFARLLAHFPAERSEFQAKLQRSQAEIAQVKESRLNDRIQLALQNSRLEMQVEELRGSMQELKARTKKREHSDVKDSEEYKEMVLQLTELQANMRDLEDHLADTKGKLQQAEAKVESQHLALEKKEKELQMNRVAAKEALQTAVRATAERDESNSRAEALQRSAQVCSPRPQRNFGRLGPLISEQETQKLGIAITRYVHLDPQNVACMLLGETLSGHSLMEFKARFLGCMQGLFDEDFTAADLEKALLSGYVGSVTNYCNEDIIQFIQQSLQRRMDVPSLMTFLTGKLEEVGIERGHFGLLAGKRREFVVDAVQKGRVPTRVRFEQMTADLGKLSLELLTLKKSIAEREARERKERENAEKLEVLIKSRKKKPIELFLEKEWGDQFVGLGPGPDVPRMLRCQTNQRIRNRGMSKRDCEKMVKQIWAAKAGADQREHKKGKKGAKDHHKDHPKDHDDKDKGKEEAGAESKEEGAEGSGAAPDAAGTPSKPGGSAQAAPTHSARHILMEEFVYEFLGKRTTTQMQLVETGYNFVYALNKYKYDADCELFLKVLKGEVKEEVYHEQVDMVRQLEALLALNDKNSNGYEVGWLDKQTTVAALHACLPNKTEERMQALIDVLDEDPAVQGNRVHYRKLFAEDKDFNQGPFAEELRDQQIEERVEYFQRLEKILYEEAEHNEMCARDMLERALVRNDPDINIAEVEKLLHQSFPDPMQTQSVTQILTDLKRGVVSSSVKADEADKKLNASFGAVVDYMVTTGRLRNSSTNNSRKRAEANLNSIAQKISRGSIGSIPMMEGGKAKEDGLTASAPPGLTGLPEKSSSSMFIEPSFESLDAPSPDLSP